MQFGLAFGYILNRTGGFANLLLMTVCNLIPIVGPIVLLGYRAEVAQALLRDGELRRHPKFDFDRFIEYLTRGGQTPTCPACESDNLQKLLSVFAVNTNGSNGATAAAQPASAGCGSCGDPRGPGACSMN